VAGESEVGGGAFAEVRLPTTLVALSDPSCEAMVEALRQHAPPVIARIEDGHVVLDVRTLADDDFALITKAVKSARGN
jgi:L-seryl-tRNA(Ser) seleniumtransferase